MAPRRSPIRLGASGMWQAPSTLSSHRTTRPSEPQHARGSQGRTGWSIPGAPRSRLGSRIHRPPSLRRWVMPRLRAQRLPPHPRSVDRRRCQPILPCPHRLLRQLRSRAARRFPTPPARSCRHRRRFPTWRRRRLSGGIATGASPEASTVASVKASVVPAIASFAASGAPASVAPSKVVASASLPASLQSGSVASPLPPHTDTQ